MPTNPYSFNSNSASMLFKLLMTITEQTIQVNKQGPRSVISSDLVVKLRGLINFKPAILIASLNRYIYKKYKHNIIDEVEPFLHFERRRSTSLNKSPSSEYPFCADTIAIA
uniref:Uncharacterized protein n=1 Tax=Cucumis melo TaxID=3656 RepID=A0A9I9E6V0_CUCME